MEAKAVTQTPNEAKLRDLSSTKLTDGEAKDLVRAALVDDEWQALSSEPKNGAILVASDADRIVQGFKM